MLQLYSNKQCPQSRFVGRVFHNKKTKKKNWVDVRVFLGLHLICTDREFLREVPLVSTKFSFKKILVIH